MGSATDNTTPASDIKEVAIIGAGFSGIASAAHLLRYGLHATVFERSSVVGGVWHFDPRCAREPPYPNERPPVPAVVQEATAQASEYGSLDFNEVSLHHAPPGPCYAGLRTNVPTMLMRSTLMSWPEGTDEFVSHEAVERYIQDLARRSGAQRHIFYDTRVDAVWKASGSSKWSVKTRTLCKAEGSQPEYEFVITEWEFDAVVVASGHYHEQRVPNIPGLREWKGWWPERVMHSNSYRTAEHFRDKTVLIIGAGVSSLDIARETNGIAKKVYQSARGGKYELPASMLPESVERIGEIETFGMPDLAHADDHDERIRDCNVQLKDGRNIHGIDRVIIATGYISSYEFLGALQSPDCTPYEASEQVIITSDSRITHNLHKDVFYIPDPTLAFVGVPYHVSTFSLFDFQAEVVARVFSGQAVLPGQETMRDEYMLRWKEKGGTKEFHSLMAKDLEYIDETLAWVNGDAERFGHKPMEGVDDRWREKYKEFLARLQKLMVGQPTRETQVDIKVGEELQVKAKGVEVQAGPT